MIIIKYNNKTANINVKKPNSLIQCVKTTCFSHKTKTANIKKVVLLSITLTFGDVMLGDTTFLIFAVLDL